MFPGIAERMTKELTALAPSTMKIKVRHVSVIDFVVVVDIVFVDAINDELSNLKALDNIFKFTTPSKYPIFFSTLFFASHPGGCPPRTQILCMDRWFYLGFLEYRPTDVDLQGRIRRVWSLHCPPKMLLNRCYVRRLGDESGGGVMRLCVV